MLELSEKNKITMIGMLKALVRKVYAQIIMNFCRDGNSKGQTVMLEINEHSNR